MYLFATLSGLAEWQFATDADENVAFMASVGSTQRVISRSNKRNLPRECITASRVRTKCHMPRRNFGPSTASSAWTGDENSGAAITNTLRRILRTELLELARWAHRAIFALAISSAPEGSSARGEIAPPQGEAPTHSKPLALNPS